MEKYDMIITIAFLLIYPICAFFLIFDAMKTSKSGEPKEENYNENEPDIRIIETINKNKKR